MDLKASTIFWLVWLVWFGVGEGLALVARRVGWLRRFVPWATLSETVWAWEHAWKVLALLIAGGLFVLILHLAFKWPEEVPW